MGQEENTRKRVVFKSLIRKLVETFRNRTKLNTAYKYIINKEPIQHLFVLLAECFSILITDIVRADILLAWKR